MVKTTASYCSSLNRCNLPPALLAGLAYQQQPLPLQLDGVLPYHRSLFARLGQQPDAAARARCFGDYMAVHFRLPGHTLTPWPEAEPVPRPQAHYRSLLLDWLFDSDSDAGAAWRLWVESRFGLRTLYHREPLGDSESPAYQRYLQAACHASSNSNSLFEQLDLLYSFCQYELAQRYPDQQQLALFRGGSETATVQADGRLLIHYNNLSSFSGDVDAAYCFGSRVHAVAVPLTKILCFDQLLPGSLGGEREFMVLGGCYQVAPAR